MVKFPIRNVVSGAALCCAFGSALAVTLRVPQDYPTVQGAIDAAPPGATVLVAPGTYRENLVFDKSLILKSRDGARTTVLDGRGTGPVVVVVGSGSELVTISGFTVTNGLNNFGLPILRARNAGGIEMQSVTGVVTDNVIRNNTGCLGDGVSASSSAMTIQRNLIVDNHQDPTCDGANGGGIFLNAGGATGTVVANNIVSGHRIGAFGAGLYVQGVPDIMVRDNLFSANDAGSGAGGLGGGIMINNVPSATVTGNAFIANSADVGGAMALFLDTENRVNVNGNLMLDNTAALSGSAIAISVFSEQSLRLLRNVVRGGTETALVDCGGMGVAVSPTNIVHNATGPELSGGCTFR